MIRVLLLDDHPALRAGLHTVLRAEPGIVPVGALSSADALVEAVERDRPDVVLLDYHLPEGDGLTLCHRLKRRAQPPKVLIYSAYADARLALSALVAGADGVAGKAAPAEELFEAIRVVSKGGLLLPPVPREVLEEASRRIDPDDLPILGMLVDHTDRAGIAEVLRVSLEELDERIRRMLGALRAGRSDSSGAAA